MTRVAVVAEGDMTSFDWLALKPIKVVPSTVSVIAAVSKIVPLMKIVPPIKMAARSSASVSTTLAPKGIVYVPAPLRYEYLVLIASRASLVVAIAAPAATSVFVITPGAIAVTPVDPIVTSPETVRGTASEFESPIKI